MKHKKYYLLEKNRDKDEFIKKAIMIISADSEDIGRRILEKSNMVELKEGYKEFSLVTYSSVVSCICNLGHIVRGSNYREYIEWEELPHRDELNVTRTVWMIDGKPEDIHYIDIDEEDADELGNYNWLQPKEIEMFESVGKVQENVEVSDQIIENTKKVKPSIIESGKCDGLMPGDEFRNLVIKNFSNAVSEVSTYKVPYYELVLEKDGIRFSVSGIAIDGVTYYTTNFPDEMYLSDSERDEEWDDLREECYNPYTKTEYEIKKGIEPSEKILKFRKIRKPALIAGVAGGFVLASLVAELMESGGGALRAIGLIIVALTIVGAYLLTKKVNKEEEDRVKAQLDKLLAEQKANYDKWEEEYSKTASSGKNKLTKTLQKFTSAKFTKKELDKIYNSLYEY